MTRMFDRMSAVLDTMPEAARAMNFSASPSAQFLIALHADLTVEVGEDVATMVAESTTLDIADDACHAEVRALAHKYAKVVVEIVRNPSFQELPSFSRRAALKSMTFTFRP